MSRRTHPVPCWYTTLRTASYNLIARCMKRSAEGTDPDILIAQGKMAVIAAMALWAALHHS